LKTTYFAWGLLEKTQCHMCVDANKKKSEAFLYSCCCGNRAQTSVT